MFKRFIQAASVVGVSFAVVFLVAGLAYNSNIANASAPAQTEQPVKRQITVSGMGKVSAQPDEASISIGAQITAPTLADATKQASDIMVKVIAALKAQGVDAKDIQTSSYSVNPITNYKENAPAEITGYQVMNVVTAKVRKLDTVGQVLDAGMAAGANYLGGVFFGIADTSKFETDARTAAVKDATAIANTLATAAGVKVGKVVSITEGVYNVPQPLPYARGAADAANSVGPVETGSLDITTNVVMVFEIAE